jgi:hypothetical protein
MSFLRLKDDKQMPHTAAVIGKVDIVDGVYRLLAELREKTASARRCD